MCSRQESLRKIKKSSNLFTMLVNRNFDDLQDEDMTIYAKMFIFTTDYYDLVEMSESLAFNVVYPLDKVKLLLKPTKNKEKEPSIVVVGCLHGNELVGHKVIKELKKIKIIKGQLKTIIANPKAMRVNKRFIDHDLNRSFPGNKNSKLLEEKLAVKILKMISPSDYVLDIHSTSSDTKNVIIIKKRNAMIDKMLSIINPNKVVLMPKNYGDGSLINFCSGISIEYGKDKNKDTFTKSLNDIKRLMSNLEMIEGNSPKIINKTEFYQVFGAETKHKGFKLNKLIHNFYRYDLLLNQFYLETKLHFFWIELNL
jgi:succinylglutamate desuccinylase